MLLLISRCGADIFARQTLSASKASSPLFRFSISAKRLDCFSRIHLDSNSMDDLINVLSLTSRLPRLHTISAIGIHITNLLSNGSTTEDAESARYWALRTLQDISPQITTLQIWESSATTATRLCRLFPKLSTLEFRHPSSLEDEVEAVEPLFAQLCKMAHLKTIRIDSPDEWLLDSTTLEDLVWPPIESFTLRVGSCQSLGFFAQLPATLRDITFETSVRPRALPPCHLPSLQSLTFVGKYSAPFFRSLPSSFPSLVELNLQVSESDFYALPTAEDLPNLRRFSFHDPGNPHLSWNLVDSGYSSDLHTKGVETYFGNDDLPDSLILAGNEKVQDMPGRFRQYSSLGHEVNATMESLNELWNHARTSFRPRVYQKLADLLRAAEMERLTQDH